MVAGRENRNRLWCSASFNQWIAVLNFCARFLPWDSEDQCFALMNKLRELLKVPAAFLRPWHIVATVVAYGFSFLGHSDYSIADMNGFLSRRGLEQKWTPEEEWYREHAPNFELITVEKLTETTWVAENSWILVGKAFHLLVLLSRGNLWPKVVIPRALCRTLPWTAARSSRVFFSLNRDSEIRDVGGERLKGQLRSVPGDCLRHVYVHCTRVNNYFLNESRKESKACCLFFPLGALAEFIYFLLLYVLFLAKCLWLFLWWLFITFWALLAGGNNRNSRLGCQEILGQSIDCQRWKTCKLTLGMFLNYKLSQVCFWEFFGNILNKFAGRNWWTNRRNIKVKLFSWPWVLVADSTHCFVKAAV